MVERDVESKNKTGKIKKKVLPIGLSVAMALGTFSTCITKVYSYKSETHKFITNQGIEILEKDKGTDISSLLTNNNGLEKLELGSTMPDFDENDGGLFAKGGFKGHYYDPATAKNYMGEKDDTANKNFENHYNNAIKLWKNGKLDEAKVELGRAEHYYQDMNVPFHAANLTALSSTTHSYYEDYVEDHQSEFAITSAPDSVYDYVQNNTVWKLGHNAAINAKNNLYFVKSLYYALDDKNKKMATQNTLPKAEMEIAALYYKFLKDAGAVK